MPGFPGDPAPRGSWVVVAGMSYTTQCHHPDTGGWYGSNIVTAKLLVPAGAWVHLSAGDWFGPWHPNVSAVNCSAMGFPGGRSGLDSVNDGSAPHAAEPSPRTAKYTA